MVIYHEASDASLKSLLQKGIMCDTRGAKSNALISKVDDFLDRHIPHDLQSKSLSRRCSVYGYAGDNEQIIDIKSGKLMPIPTFVVKPNTVLLRLDVDESRCFVSDLDVFDAIKSIVQNNMRPSISDAYSYWNSLIPLTQFSVGAMSRPEIMIPFSISPEQIRIIG